LCVQPVNSGYEKPHHASLEQLGTFAV